jgi:SAM-dependent methyltransferase
LGAPLAGRGNLEGAEGRHGVSRSQLSDDERRNQRHWDSDSDAYQERHREFIGRPEPRWGIWQLPEDELRILGDVAGKDVLELGCGAAQWSILLARRGARPTGLDNSERQLEHARRLMREAGVDFPLVHASAQSIPLPDESFDVVFCDHGALGWSDPYATVPEAARVLRRGGLLAFSITSPLASLCWHPETDQMEPRLHRPYFGMHRLGDETSVNYQLPYGEWIRLLRRNGLTVEDLVEPQPPPNARSTYWDEAELEWARQWPSEAVWKARKE